MEAIRCEKESVRPGGLHREGSAEPRDVGGLWELGRAGEKLGQL